MDPAIVSVRAALRRAFTDRPKLTGLHNAARFASAAKGELKDSPLPKEMMAWPRRPRRSRITTRAEARPVLRLGAGPEEPMSTAIARNATDCVQHEGPKDELHEVERVQAAISDVRHHEHARLCQPPASRRTRSSALAILVSSHCCFSVLREVGVNMSTIKSRRTTQKKTNEHGHREECHELRPARGTKG